MLETNPKFLAERLIEDYQRQQALFSAQPAIVQRYLETQGKQIAQAVVDGESQISFSLPDRVVCTIENVDQPALVTIPHNQRARSAGSFMNRFRKVELYKEMRHAFSELEQSPDRAISVCGRAAAACHRNVHGLSNAPGRTERLLPTGG